MAKLRGYGPLVGLWRLMLATLVGLGLGTARPANSHGLGQQVLKEVAAGPYTVSVWIDPAEPVVDEALHVTVSVQREAESIINARVTLTATHQANAQRTPVTATASHEGAVNRLFYEGALVLPDTGSWTVAIAIDAEDGPAEASFDLDVGQAGSDRWWLTGGGLAAILAGGGLLFYILRRRRQLKETNS